MRSDASIAFVQLGAPLSLVAGAGVVVTSNVIDLLGLGAGIAPTGNAAQIIGNATLWGADLGVGGGNRPELMIGIGTAVTGVNGQQLKIALQAAPDLGTPTFQPGTWQDVDSQDGISLANLTAGAVPFRTPFIPTMPPGLRPRFMRLAFSPMTTTALPSGSFTGGTIAFALVTFVRDDQANRFASKNYTVA